MGFFEKDKNDLTGNSIIVNDLTFTWDDKEALPLDAESFCETDKQEKWKQNAKPPGAFKNQPPAFFRKNEDRALLPAPGPV